MKSSRIVLSLVTLTLAAFAAAPLVRAQTQDQPSADQPAPPKHHKKMDRLKMLQHRLGLTDDQSAKVGAIFAKQQADLKAIRSDDSLDKDQKRAKARAIFEQSNKDVRALLTPDQIQKLDDLRDHHRKPSADAPVAPPPSGN